MHSRQCEIFMHNQAIVTVVSLCQPSRPDVVTVVVLRGHLIILMMLCRRLCHFDPLGVRYFALDAQIPCRRSGA